MNTINRTIIVLALLLNVSLSQASAQHVTFNTIDSLLAMQDVFLEKRQAKIDRIRRELNSPTLSPRKRYDINYALFNEYIALKYDSAYKYATLNIKLGEAMKDAKRESQSKLCLAHVLSVAGLFEESDNLINSIDTTSMDNGLLVDYYNQCCENALYKSEFALNSPYYYKYDQQLKRYRHALVSKTDTNTFSYRFNQAVLLCNNNMVERGIDSLKAILPHYKSGDRSYSITANTIAHYYSTINDSENHKKYLLLCAASDIEGYIMENNSMRELANLCYNEGDIDRANKFMLLSLENAVYYGSRLRNVQSTQLFPTIQYAYRTYKEKAEQKQRYFLISLLISTMVLLVLMVAITIILRKYRRLNTLLNASNENLHSLNQQLNHNNEKLSIQTQLKEAYMRQFLTLSSHFIDLSNNYIKNLTKLARNKKIDQLIDELKSNALSKSHSALFFQQFDDAFLKVYPNFINQVNSLLIPDEKIEIKQMGKLNTELRILALLRLGINDSTEIATILKSSSSTIYTYRSRLKSKAINKSSFERDIATTR